MSNVYAVYINDTLDVSRLIIKLHSYSSLSGPSLNMYVSETRVSKIMRRLSGRSRTIFGTLKKKDKNQYVSVVCMNVRLQDGCSY